MQTIPQKPADGLTFRHEDTQFIILDPQGRNCGRIAYDLTAHRWEYNPYGQPVKTVGSLEACQDAARTDYEQYLNVSTVTDIAAKSTPAYLAQGGSWKTAGYGNVRAVTVVTRDNERYTVSVPDGFARQLRVGSTVQLRHSNGQLSLTWTRKPVRRQMVEV